MKSKDIDGYKNNRDSSILFIGSLRVDIYWLGIYFWWRSIELVISKI